MTPLPAVQPDVTRVLTAKAFRGLGRTDFGVAMLRGARSWGELGRGAVTVPHGAGARAFHIAHDGRGAPYVVGEGGRERADVLVSRADEEDLVACARARVARRSTLLGMGPDLAASSDFDGRPTSRRFAHLLFGGRERAIACLEHPDDPALGYAVLFGAAFYSGEKAAGCASGALSGLKVYRHLSKDGLRLDLLPRIRETAVAKKAGSPWGTMGDDERLRSADLYRKDCETGEEGFTLGAALVLGKGEVIARIAPAYKTDARAQLDKRDRYDDRLVVRTNLIEAYGQLLAFAQRHLPDKFFPEGTQTASRRDAICRELSVRGGSSMPFQGVTEAEGTSQRERARARSGKAKKCQL